MEHDVSDWLGLFVPWDRQLKEELRSCDFKKLYKSYSTFLFYLGSAVWGDKYLRCFFLKDIHLVGL